MAADGKPSEKPPADAEQWRLALAHLKRANDAGNILRVLLFAASCGFIAYILPSVRPGGGRAAMYGHIAAIVLSGLALLQLVRSWQMQMEQSDERFKFLRTRDYDSYLQYDAAIQAGSKRNERLDWRAFLLLAVALLIELAVRAFGVAHAVNV
jgi:hypothetical protein